MRVSQLGMHAPLTVPFMDGAAAGLQLTQFFFVSDGYYELVEVRVNHDVDGGSGATVDIVKCASGTSPASGVSMLATAFALSSGADTPQRRAKSVGTLSATATSRVLIPGDSLALVYAGTLTGLLGVGGCVVLKRTRYNPER